jgi:hypothetical protein
MGGPTHFYAGRTVHVKGATKGSRSPDCTPALLWSFRICLPYGPARLGGPAEDYLRQLTLGRAARWLFCNQHLFVVAIKPGLAISVFTTFFAGADVGVFLDASSAEWYCFPWGAHCRFTQLGDWGIPPRPLA